MQSLLQAALDLSTSTKPYDSVTAAHLLNMLLHQPTLSQALQRCAQEQGLTFRPPVQLPPQASEALVLEINTLAGKNIRKDSKQEAYRPPKLTLAGVCTSTSVGE